MYCAYEHWRHWDRRTLVIYPNLITCKKLPIKSWQMTISIFRYPIFQLHLLVTNRVRMVDLRLRSACESKQRRLSNSEGQAVSRHTSIRFRGTKTNEPEADCGRGMCISAAARDDSSVADNELKGINDCASVPPGWAYSATRSSNFSSSHPLACPPTPYFNRPEKRWRCPLSAST